MITKRNEKLAEQEATVIQGRRSARAREKRIGIVTLGNPGVAYE